MRRSVCLALALLALTVAGCADGDDEAKALAVVEEFTAAVNAYDTDAIRGVVTQDFTWQSTGPVADLDEYLGYVDANYETLGFHVEAVGDPEVRLDGEEYVVEQQDVATATGLDLVGTTTHRLVEVDGAWMIRESRWVKVASGSTG